MSRWSRPTSKPPEPEPEKIEIEGLAASCQRCTLQPDITYYIPEIKVVTWKCEGCQKINILEGFEFFL